MSRVPSGVERLDRVLGGGLPADSITILMGLPGTGKTILAQQYLFRNGTEERPALYLSTISEPLEKTLRYGQTLSFFDAGAVGTRVCYDDLVTNGTGAASLDGVLERIVTLVRERHPGFIVIDSFKALHALASQQGEFRRFLRELAGRLSVYPATSLWVGEYSIAEYAGAPEFAVADAVVSLSLEPLADRESRVLQVLKLRGSSFLAGKHAYRLSPDGIDVFPRLADPGDASSYVLEEQRISSGIPLMDRALSGGYWPGASTLVAGPSGTGKTLMGLHFVFKGAERGEPGLIATFQEDPSQLERIVRGYGWSLARDDVHLMYRTPVDLYVDEWVYDLLGRLEEHGIRRVLIDSLGDMRAAARDEVRFREYVYSLLQRTARAGISVFMTQEVPELFGATELSEYGISHMSDNVVLLQFVRGQSQIKRALAVVKARATRHDPAILEYEITSNGIEPGEQFADDQDWT